MRKISAFLLLLFCCTGSVRAGSIVRLVYDGIAGTTVSNLTTSGTFPNNPTRTNVLTVLLEAPANDGDNFGAYLRGWIEAPQTGDYIFWIASDDQSELWLSPDANPAGKIKIAYEPIQSTPRNWDGLVNRKPGAPENKSALVHLVRGQKYYLEVLHKDGSGSDHVAVGWRLPDLSLERPVSLLHVQQFLPTNSAPVITLPPQNLSIPANNTAVFSVAVNAAPPPSYQWQQSSNGVNFFNLPAETLAYVTLKAVPAAANGRQFRVIATNPLGSVTSSVATLTVTADTAAPTILSAAVVESPDCVNHYVEVIFSEPVDVATATLLAGYVLTNTSGNVGLTGATVSPQRPERVLLQTTSPLPCGSYGLTVNAVQDTAGNPITSTTVSFDTATLDCCNQSYTLNLPAGSSLIADHLVLGGNTLAEVLPAVPNGTTLRKFNPATQLYETEIVFSGGAGWSDPLTTLAPGEGALLVLPSPASITFFGGRVVPSPPLPGAGYVLLSAQTPNPAGFADILGFAPTEGSLIVQLDSARQLYRTNYFRNGAWHDQAPLAAVGESVFYAQLTPVTITTQPVGFTNTVPGVDVVFSVEANGTGPLTYHWRRNGNLIPGANGTIYTVVSAQLSDGGSYSVAVENPVGGVNSVEVVLSFNTPPFSFADNFGTSPLPQTEAQHALTGSNAGATNETGEIRHAGKPGGSSVWVDWTAPATGIVLFETRGSSFDTLLAAYTGTSVTNLTELASDDDGAGYHNSRIVFNATEGTTYRIAIDGFHSATGTVVLAWELETTPDTLPVITTQPHSVTVAPGDPVQFTVSATGASLAYQWYLNGAEIPGADTDSYSVAGAQFSNAGDYFVRVTRNGRFLDSRTATLQLNVGDPGAPLQNVRAPDKFFDSVDEVFDGGSGGNSHRGGPARGVQVVAHGYSGQSLFTTTGATKDIGEPNHAGEPGGKSEWFAFQADTNGTLYVNTDGSSYNTVLAVYVGPGDSYVTLTNVASDNNSGSNGLTSKLSLPAAVNTIFWIAVDGVGGVGGSVKLNYRLVQPLTLTNLSRTTNNNGRLIFKVNGTPNLATKIQASTNLGSTNWTSLFTNTPVSGSFNYTNTNNAVFPRRFFRAIQQF